MVLRVCAMPCAFCVFIFANQRKKNEKGVLLQTFLSFRFRDVVFAEGGRRTKWEFCFLIYKQSHMFVPALLRVCAFAFGILSFALLSLQKKGR